MDFFYPLSLPSSLPPSLPISQLLNYYIIHYLKSINKNDWSYQHCWGEGEYVC